MSLLFGIPILGLLAAIQATLLTHFRVLGGSPDLILLAVVTWSLIARDADAFVWAVVGGLMLDLLSAGPFGLNAALLVVITYFVGWSGGRFWQTHVLLPLAAVVGASFASHLMMLTALALMGRSIDWTYSLTQVMLPTVFFNLLLTLPAVYLTGRFKHFLYPPKVAM